MNNLPNFLCVGAQRAGTTWLHNCLTEHPQLFLPQTKEVHYFDRQYEKGFAWYLQHFDGNKGELIGEITPNYYHAKGALKRIKQDLPEVKLIFIIREPISRAYSQFQLFKQSDFAGKTFDEIINTEKSVIELSLQGERLTEIYSLFDKKNVLVLFYDELSTKPERLLKKVFNFLGVNPDFRPSKLNKRINRVVLPNLQKTLNRIGLSWLITLVKKSLLAEMIKNIFHKNATDSEISRKTLSTLNKSFEKDIVKLEKILDINLNHWKRK